MKPFRLVTLFLVLASPGAVAFDWPWSSNDVEQTKYCKGLVTAGLSSPFVLGDQRRDLWLAWNYLIRTDGVGHAEAREKFEEGRGFFAQVTDIDSATARLGEVQGECGLGRSGRQISGW
ncbi:MAG: hypothetical protein Hals2KO_04180 [Halioglobus sp.]